MSAYRQFLSDLLIAVPGIRETRTYTVMEEVKGHDQPADLILLLFQNLAHFDEVRANAQDLETECCQMCWHDPSVQGSLK